MCITDRIIRIEEKAKIYPGRDAYKVTMLGTDNKHYEATKGKAAVELSLYLKSEEKNNNIDYRTAQKLIQMINDFGDERYEEAADEAAMNAAGEDL